MRFTESLKEQFSFIKGNYLILIISWILMDFAGELPGTYYSDYVIQLGGSATIIGLISLVSQPVDGNEVNQKLSALFRKKSESTNQTETPSGADHTDANKEDAARAPNTKGKATVPAIKVNDEKVNDDDEEEKDQGIIDCFPAICYKKSVYP
jgi:hypothetical protein